MAARISWNRRRGTATSAIWKAIDRPCRTILAPIFTSRSRRVVSDHRLTSSGSAESFFYSTISARCRCRGWYGPGWSCRSSAGRAGRQSGRHSGPGRSPRGDLPVVNSRKIRRTISASASLIRRPLRLRPDFGDGG
jgi:hypothetical protein